VYDEDYVQKRIELADSVEEMGEKLSATLHASGRDDMSILAMQRLNEQYVCPIPVAPQHIHTYIQQLNAMQCNAMGMCMQPAERAGDAGGHGGGLLQVRLRVRGAAARDQPAEHRASRDLQRLRRRRLLRRRPAGLRGRRLLPRRPVPQDRRQVWKDRRPAPAAQQGIYILQACMHGH
jgi:hypothetical protein